MILDVYKMRLATVALSEESCGPCSQLVFPLPPIQFLKLILRDGTRKRPEGSSAPRPASFVSFSGTVIIFNH